MACFRSFSRKSLYPKWFCCKILSPDVLHQQHVRDYPESSFPDSSLLIRRFHRHALLDDRKKTAFGSTSEGSSGLLLCRLMSSKPEESYSKIDAFENIAGELVSEKTVEAMATNLSTPAAENFDFPAYMINGIHELPANLINGIHELTGFNWWISIVLTALLVNGLMSPLSARTLRLAWELDIVAKETQMFLQQRKASGGPDHLTLIDLIEWKEEVVKKFTKVYWSFTAFFLLNATMYIFFMDRIGIMAKKIPELSTSDSLYILPLMTGFTFWWASEINTSGSNLSSRMMKLPLFLFTSIAFQDIFQFKPAVYFFQITSCIYISTLFYMLKTNRIVKMRRILGWPDVPITKVSEQQSIMARLIDLMTDVVKKKDKK